MQSSAAVAGRALIMLACVVGLPAWALSGVSWSDTLKKLQDYHWPAILNPATASTSSTLSEAPRFAQPRQAIGPASGRNTAPLAQIGGSTTVRPVSTDSAVAKQGPTSVSSGVMPVGYQTPVAVESAAGLNPVDKAADAATLSGDPYQAIPKRLRELGATYYVLESWGNDQQMYRFCCKVAVGGSADYSRCFEAAHSDPIQAMRQVLQEVVAWRGAGRIEDVSMRN